MSTSQVKKRILCFGDSLTEGGYNGGFKFHPYTTRLKELFQEMMADSNHSVEIVNKGISGEVVYPEMVKRLPTILRNEGPYDFAIFLGGTNDLINLKCAQEVNLFVHIKSLHQAAHERGIPTCAMTIPQTAFDILPYLNDYVEYRETVNNEIRDFVSNHSEMVCLCDVSKKLPMHGICDGELVKCWDDEYHFTPEGSDRLAELIFEAVKDHFNPLTTSTN